MPSSSFPFLPTKANLPQRLKPARLLAGYCSAKALLHPKAPSKAAPKSSIRKLHARAAPEGSTQELHLKAEPKSTPKRAVQLSLTHSTTGNAGRSLHSTAD